MVIKNREFYLPKNTRNVLVIVSQIRPKKRNTMTAKIKMAKTNHMCSR